MRYTYIFISLLFIVFGSGQENKITQAIFSDCITMPMPNSCTHLKFREGIWQLFDKDIEQELRENSIPHLSLAIQFISDEAGTVIEDKITVLCNNNKLRDAVIAHIKTLKFTPKDASLPERRSVHSYVVAFIKNDFNEGYHIALPEEIRERGIKPDIVPLDEYPVFKGCEGAVNDKNNSCISAKVREFIIKNFRTPRTSRATNLKMYIHFYIDEDGKIIIDKITGGVDPYAKEVYRVIEKAPKAIPGKVSGIPVKTSFILPLVINIR